MRQFSIWTFFLLIFWTCKPTTEKKSEPVNSSKPIEQVIGKKFFAYDAIDYYTIDFDDSKIVELYDNESKSELDSFKTGLILDYIPKDISDLGFINQLEKVGYKKTQIDKSEFESIDSIFVEKTTKENLVTSCIYVYRDILLFKKENKVIGTAKICFSCMDNQIHGTAANTENFGQEGDYERLEKILSR